MFGCCITDEKMRNHLTTAAAGFIILFALRELNTIVAPILLSCFICLMLAPVVDRLERLKIPRALGAASLILVFFSIISVTAKHVTSSASEFIKDSPNILANVQGKLVQYEMKASELIGIEIDVLSHLNIGKLVQTSASILGEITALMSTTLLVLLISYFMLMEASRWKKKLIDLYGGDKELNHINLSVSKYITTKTITSIITGVIISGGLFILGDKYWPLWGFTAFVLNFIPSIGSFIAAVPAVAMSFLGLDTTVFISTVLLYAVTNVAIGSLVEPRMLGEALGLSTLVILLSMLFWGFWFGLVGMFLSVPITIFASQTLKNSAGGFTKLLEN